MTDGDSDTALEEAESGVHLVERGFADYILAPVDRLLASSRDVWVIFRRRREEDAHSFRTAGNVARSILVESEEQ
jgi:hypothetical protein